MAFKKAPTKKERGKQKTKRDEDQIKLIELKFQRWQVAGFMKARRRQDIL